jgi:hypothetical protein
MRSSVLAEIPSRAEASALDKPHAFISARNALRATSLRRARSLSFAKVWGSTGSVADIGARLGVRISSPDEVVRII